MLHYRIPFFLKNFFLLWRYNSLKRGSLDYFVKVSYFILSSFYCLISLAYENDDELKSCLSGAVTGALYKSTAGVKKTAAGAAIGLGIAATWYVLMYFLLIGLAYGHILQCAEYPKYLFLIGFNLLTINVCFLCLPGLSFSRGTNVFPTTSKEQNTLGLPKFYKGRDKKWWFLVQL